jgi:hypothetical protein
MSVASIIDPALGTILPEILPVAPVPHPYVESVVAGANIAVNSTVSTAPVVSLTTSVSGLSQVISDNVIQAGTNPAGQLYQSGVPVVAVAPNTDGVYIVNCMMEWSGTASFSASAIITVSKKSPIGPLFSQVFPTSGLSFTTPPSTPTTIAWAVSGTNITITQTNPSGNSYGGAITVFKCCKNTLF